MDVVAGRLLELSSRVGSMFRVRRGELVKTDLLLRGDSYILLLAWGRSAHAGLAGEADVQLEHLTDEPSRRSGRADALARPNSRFTDRAAASAQISVHRSSSSLFNGHKNTKKPSGWQDQPGRRPKTLIPKGGPASQMSGGVSCMPARCLGQSAALDFPGVSRIVRFTPGRPKALA